MHLLVDFFGFSLSSVTFQTPFQVDEQLSAYCSMCCGRGQLQEIAIILTFQIHLSASGQNFQTLLIDQLFFFAWFDRS